MNINNESTKAKAKLPTAGHERAGETWHGLYLCICEKQTIIRYIETLDVLLSDCQPLTTERWAKRSGRRTFLKWDKSVKRDNEMLELCACVQLRARQTCPHLLAGQPLSLSCLERSRNLAPMFPVFLFETKPPSPSISHEKQTTIPRAPGTTEETGLLSINIPLKDMKAW